MLKEETSCDGVTAIEGMLKKALNITGCVRLELTGKITCMPGLKSYPARSGCNLGLKPDEYKCD